MLAPGKGVWALGALLALACGPQVGNVGEQDSSTTSPGDDTGDTGPDDSSGEIATADSSSAGDPPLTCEPGSAEPCYSGPPRTEGVGECTGGTRTCAPDGTGWSACEGEVVPAGADLCLTAVDEGCGAGLGCSPELAWSYEFNARITAMQTDASGNVLIAGTGETGAELGGHSLADMFFAALDSEGNVRWAHNVEELNRQVPTRLAVDAASGVTIVGTYESSPDFGDGPLNVATGIDAFAVRYDPRGTLQWSFGFNLPIILDVAATTDGGFVLLGRGEGFQIRGTPLTTDSFAAGFDAAGDLEWVAEGELGYAEYVAVTAAADGGVAVTVIPFTSSPVALGGDSTGDAPPGEGRVVQWLLDDAGQVLTRGETAAPLGSATALGVHPDAGGTHIVGQTWQQPRPAVFISPLFRAQFNATASPTSSEVVTEAFFLASSALLPDGSTAILGRYAGAFELGPTLPDADEKESTWAVASIDAASVATWAFVLDEPAQADLGPFVSDPTGALLLAGAYETGFLRKLVP